MREPRNPFRLRASEDIESDATFLRLFEPAMLDLLPSEQFWERVCILRSAPGGGKTSLMRLFTPHVLLTLHVYRTREDSKELYNRLEDLGVIGEAGPRLLGVMLSCSRNYATLADLEIDDARKERLLFGLLNARVILAALRGALVLRKLDYPDGVHRLTVAGPSETEPPAGLQFPCAGEVLYEWAKKVEAEVCEAIDSFGPPRASSLPGQDALNSLTLIRPERLTIDGTPITDRTLVMFDDVHKLTAKQRETLLKGLVELRSPVCTWVAERFEALSTDEMLSPGATAGRDYDSVIQLEQFWREKGRKQRFEKLLLSVADRRARAATAVDIPSFASCLQSSLEGTQWQDRIVPAINQVAERIRAVRDKTALYEEWITAREKMEGTATEKLIAWRTLEILIQRDRRKKQKTFDFPLSSEELEEREGSDVEAAAELFLARELGLPYYFGPTRLANLASSNIEQFLWLAGDQFEEAVSAALLKRPTDLPPERQEAIIRRAVTKWWEEIPLRVPNGRRVRDFLEAIGKFANSVTYQPNAPYSPGVTGIAISMADRDLLRDPKSLKGTPALQELAAAITSAIAHNLLEPILDYKVKGGRWMVLYLNRALCVKFALPLHYGGFRERTLTELGQWLEHGFRPKEEAMLL
ncbi:MAG: hypothetical protein HY645_10435 [Acidobacteria bacterium]|nr:hypothetical protein [Acidobacteriota bacterium]